MFDGEIFGQQMVEIVRGYVDAEIASLKEENAALAARIADMEQRAPVPGEAGADGQQGVPGERGEAGPAGPPGRDADMDHIQQLIEDHVAQVTANAIAALPEAAPGQDGERGERGEAGAAGADGIGLCGAVIDRRGHLMLTMSDGQISDVGMVVGRDGARGQDGESLSLDDFDIEQIDDRSLKFCFTKGDTMHSFEIEFPFLIYRGVWESRDYSAGDAVTWAGSMWVAERATAGKPDTSDSGWRLAVKKGRDAKSA